MAPLRHAAPGGGVEFEVDPETGHAAWRVDGRRVGVQRARAVAGDASVDRILRASVRELRARALDAGADGERLRALAGRIWRERRGPAAGADAQDRLF
jgi:hypothetical protein